MRYHIYNQDIEDYHSVLTTENDNTNINKYDVCLNFRIGEDLIKDISFRYKNEKNDLESEDNQYIYDKGSYSNYLHLNETNELEKLVSKEKIKSYGSSIMISKCDNKYFRRFYLSADYNDESLNYLEYENYERNSYEDNILERHDLRDEVITSDITRKFYKCTAGFGTNTVHKKLELLYGLKINGSYAEFKGTEFAELYQLEEQVYQDSTHVEEETESYSSFSFAKEYIVSGEFPLGVIY